MNTQIAGGILLPFLGTSLGAAMVFILKDTISKQLQRVLTGFAAGVMVAATYPCRFGRRGCRSGQPSGMGYCQERSNRSPLL